MLFQPINFTSWTDTLGNFDKTAVEKFEFESTGVWARLEGFRAQVGIGGSELVHRPELDRAGRCGAFANVAPRRIAGFAFNREKGQ